MQIVKEKITQTIQDYFLGAYQGETEKLLRAFHPAAHITGLFKGQYVDWTLNDFIQRVTERPTAADKNDPYQKEIVSLDITENAAIAKAKVVVGGIVFIDYITLLNINGQWCIRNKCFITLADENF
ncbi:MAG: hypothetical protein K0S08_777 [Gammaproteobacteria bacterium]|jgi:hypothetical protein|nr:hypothetical protein [Gammaproteobacteria bacterium]